MMIAGTRLVRGKIAVALCALGLATIAHADTTLSLPGSQCVRQNAASAGIFYESGRAGNPSSGLVTYQCPIIRRSDVSDSVPFTTLRVIVNDQHPTEPVSCSFLTCPLTGALCSVNGFVDSVGTGVQTLSLPDSNSVDVAAAWFRCTLPPASGSARSQIVAYRWRD